MLIDLLLLLTSLGLRDGSALDLAADVRAVVASEPPLLEDRATTARLLAVWAYHESAGRNVLGDHGAACGVLQLHEVARHLVQLQDAARGPVVAQHVAARRLMVRPHGEQPRGGSAVLEERRLAGDDGAHVGRKVERRAVAQAERG